MAGDSTFQAAFRSAFTSAAGLGAADPATTRRALDALCAQARAAGGPGRQGFRGGLARFFVDRAGATDDPLAAVAKLHVSDLFLAFACAQGDASAITVFRKQLIPRAAGAAAKVNRSGGSFFRRWRTFSLQKLLVRTV